MTMWSNGFGYPRETRHGLFRVRPRAVESAHPIYKTWPTLPADDLTVAMNLLVVMDRAKTFAPIKSASAAIAFYQMVNLYSHNPTMAPKACMARRAAARKFGLSHLGRKAQFQWAQLMLFAEAYGVTEQGY